MGWWNSLFTSSSNSSARDTIQSNSRAFDSADDAFSLPMSSSPTLTPMPDTAGSSFTYPPTYASVATNSTRPILPTHHDVHTRASGGPTHPAKSWNRIRSWLHREYPELGDTLNYGIQPHELEQIETQFGFALPAAVRESYLAVDGQEPESSAGCSDGLFFGLSLLPLEDVLQEWRFWRAVDGDPSTGGNPQLRELMQSIPPGWIRREYSQRGWIPLIADKTGNYIGVDVNPDSQGQVGQVIVFGRDFDSKVVLWRGDGPNGWATWLATFADDLVSGEGFELGASGEPSSGSEDDVGYESYFYDGVEGSTGEPGSGGGGIRMTGEYRGWNVLEAFADRSVKKWYEAGVISEAPMAEEEKSKPNNAINITKFSSNAAAEVAIPILKGEIEDDVEVDHNRRLGPPLSEVPPSPTSATALTQDQDSSREGPPLRLPSISVTKPPVPLPVELPTPRDISSLPSPPDSRSNSFDNGRDLEEGMREAQPELISRRSPHQTQQQLPRRSPQMKEHPLEQDEGATGGAVKAEAAEIPDLLTGLDKDQPLVDTTEIAEVPATTTSPAGEKREEGNLSTTPTTDVAPLVVAKKSKTQGEPMVASPSHGGDD